MKSELILPSAGFAIPSRDKLHKDLRETLPYWGEMVDHMDKYEEPITVHDWSEGSNWAKALGIVTQYGHGIYSVPYLNPAYCKDLVEFLDTVPHEVNEMEPESAQIPEVVFQNVSWHLWHCFQAIWNDAGRKLGQVLLGIDGENLESVQAARYTPDNTPQGSWHIDQDSEVTLVVALTDSHKGGGTMVYNGPFQSPIKVPQLPAGHAMLFKGRLNPHYGLPVSNGERRLLVHWSTLNNDSE